MDICQLRSFLRSERTIGNHAKTLTLDSEILIEPSAFTPYDNRDMPVIAVRAHLAWSEYHNIANVTCRIVNPIAESASGITPTSAHHQNGFRQAGQAVHDGYTPTMCTDRMDSHCRYHRCRGSD